MLAHAQWNSRSTLTPSRIARHPGRSAGVAATSLGVPAKRWIAAVAPAGRGRGGVALASHRGDNGQSGGSRNHHRKRSPTALCRAIFDGPAVDGEKGQREGEEDEDVTGWDATDDEAAERLKEMLTRTLEANDVVARDVRVAPNERDDDDEQRREGKRKSAGERLNQHVAPPLSNHGELSSAFRMPIIFVSAEVAPWSKTGGLGDVCGALPAALAARGHSVGPLTTT